MAIEDTVALLIQRGDRFLLIRRKAEPEKGYWSLPGGHVGHFESPLVTAKREGKEEVGKIEVEERPIYVFVHDVGLGHRHRCRVFRAHLFGEPKGGGDAATPRWFTLEGMKRLKLTESTLHIFNTLFFR